MWYEWLVLSIGPIVFGALVWAYMEKFRQDLAYGREYPIVQMTDRTNVVKLDPFRNRKKG